jgi:2-desacetyl-2-hydroxyethyl bacteriochlorophyllide A dehydrogenase
VTGSNRAVVVERPGETTLREVEMPTCGSDDVLIRSHFAGVCRTDIKIANGKMPSNAVSYPCIPGHEWSGTVEAVGDRVSDLEVGARVVAEGMQYCGHCDNCLAGQTNLCRNYQQLGFTRPGGYARYVVVPRRYVHVLPDNVSFGAGVLIEPASCVAYGFDRLAPQEGETIGVVGVGTLGSLAILMANSFMPGAVIAYGVNEADVELASALGADHAIDVSQQDPVAATGKVLGSAPDVVLEAAGATDAVTTALGLARRGGRVVLMGSAGDGLTMNLPTDVFMRKDLTVHGTLSYTSNAWAQAMSLMKEGLDVERLLTHRVPLDAYEDAFTLMDDASQKVVKVLLEHG